MIQQLGIIGHPIAHSLSPVLHGFLIDELNLSFRYNAFDVTDRNLREALTGARALGFRGLNVTVPHKQAIMPLLDGIDAFALKAGAVNTIVFDQDAAIGYNTDLFGFIDCLALQEIRMTDRDVVIIGAGGAASAIASAAQQEQAKSIHIYNRTSEKAEQLAQKFNCNTIELAAMAKLSRDCLVINATSVGMSPAIEQSPLPAELFYSDNIYVDIVYNPQKTLFLKYARGTGAKTVEGLSMLAFQGIMALEIWSGRQIDRKKFWPPLQELLLEKLKS